MKFGRLNHIGVATPSIADSIAFYRDVMGATKIHEPFDMPDQVLRVCFVETPGTDGALNGTQIELIEPLPGNTSITGFLAKNPAGGGSITYVMKYLTSIPQRRSLKLWASVFWTSHGSAHMAR